MKIYSCICQEDAYFSQIKAFKNYKKAMAYFELKVAEIKLNEDCKSIEYGEDSCCIKVRPKESYYPKSYTIFVTTCEVVE